MKPAIQERGYCFEVMELPDSTRTAQQAASAIGCSFSEIAKSLIFKGFNSWRPILVIASRTNQVHTGKVAELID